MEPISSAPYLCTEEGLAMLRETMFTVNEALVKINQLKHYIKQQILRASNYSEDERNMAYGAIDYLDKSLEINSVNDCLNKVSESTMQNIKIEGIDFSDYLHKCRNNTPSGNSYSRSFPRVFDNIIEGASPNAPSSHSKQDFSFQDDISSWHQGISFTSSDPNKHSAISQEKTDSQVFFTILHQSLSEAEMYEAFEKQGFKDFSVVIKNKELHSIGFIKFSNEVSAKEAVEMSLKILISGKPIKILPFKKKSLDRKKNFGLRSPTSMNQGATNQIDENILINFACDHEHNKVMDRGEPFESRSFDVVDSSENTPQHEIPLEPIAPPFNIAQEEEAIKTTRHSFRKADTNFTHYTQSQNKHNVPSDYEKDLSLHCIENSSSAQNLSINFFSKNCTSVNSLYSELKETPPVLWSSFGNTDKNKSAPYATTGVNNKVLELQHPQGCSNNVHNGILFVSNKPSRSQAISKSNNKNIKRLKIKNKTKFRQSQHFFKRKKSNKKFHKRLQKACNLSNNGQ